MRGRGFGLFGAACASCCLALVAAQGCNALLGNEEARLVEASPGDGSVPAPDRRPPRADAPADARGDGSRDAGSDAGSDAGDPCLGLDAGSPDEAGFETCDGAPAYVLGDPQNCGQCGHSCLGGACAGSVCVPAVIYQELNEGGAPTGGASALGVAGGRLYWTYPTAPPGSTGKWIRSIPTDPSVDGGMPSNLAGGPVPGGVLAAAVDSSGVYYAVGYEVYRAPLDGAKPSLLAHLDSSPAGLALDESNVYLSNGGSIQLVPKSGSDAGAAPFWTGSYPSDMAFDPPWTAWLTNPWSADASGPNALWRTKEGGSPSPAPLGSSLPSGLTAWGGQLYWYEAATGEVVRAQAGDLSDGGRESLGAWVPDGGLFPEQAKGLAPSGRYAYVGLQVIAGITNQLRIVRYSACGGDAESIYDSVALMPAHIVQDDMALYWGGYGGAIYRLAKSP